MSTSTDLIAAVADVGPSLVLMGFMIGSGIVISFVAWSFVSNTVGYIFFHFKPHPYDDEYND